MTTRRKTTAMTTAWFVVILLLFLVAELAATTSEAAAETTSSTAAHEIASPSSWLEWSSKSALECWNTIATVFPELNNKHYSYDDNNSNTEEWSHGPSGRHLSSGNSFQGFGIGFLLSQVRHQISFLLVELPWKLWNSIPRDALVPLLVIIILCWPLFVSLLYACMTASTWMIWLFTSLILGILQVLYVTYQFVMITLDLCGLSFLKAYSTARNWILYNVVGTLLVWSNTISGQQLQQPFLRKSRRKVWQERLKSVGSYENFLKIRIEPKEEEEVWKNHPDASKNANPLSNQSTATKSILSKHAPTQPGRDIALPPLSSAAATTATRQRSGPKRSNSFDNGNKNLAFRSTSSLLSSANPENNNLNQKSTVTLPRVSSMGQLSSNTDSSFFRHQPIFTADGTDALWMSSAAVADTTVIGGEESPAPSPRHQEQENGVVDPVVSQELGERTAYLLATTTERLLDARRQAEQRCRPTKKNSSSVSTREEQQEVWNRLKYLLSAVVKRNHLHLETILVENARSVAFAGRYGLTSQSRQVIRAFYEQVQKGLDFLADGPAFTTDSNSQQQAKLTRSSSSNLSGDDGETSPTPSCSSSASSTSTSSVTIPTPPAASTEAPQPSLKNASVVVQPQSETGNENEELFDRIRVLRKMKHNMGRTALMLSGGGAQAMYHVGIIRALIQSKLYPDISVISGTSGGSIIAAMCACKTSDELFQQVCIPTSSTDFKNDGYQKKHNIRWFPSAMEMASYWFKHKYLVNSAEFRRTCEFYYGDTTFEEAFEWTGKHVCITVSASRTSGDSASQRLLLNHISTPRVTLASAVAASCALPGVMAPAKLLTKNSVGVLEPFEVDGVEWIDGSVQADLPFQRIATLFAVTNFIVSQTNFHIVPFLNKEHHPNPKSLYWRLFQTMEWDIRSRALKLSRLGLFPRIFGQDISKVFKQKYHGNLTIVPRFTTMQTFGLHALSHPTVEDMKHYIKYGEIATWPYLNAIRDMIRLEKVVDDCLNRLEHRLGTTNPEWYDDIESITSSNFHYHHHSFSSHRSVGGINGGSSTIISLPSSAGNHHHSNPNNQQRMVTYASVGGGPGSSVASNSRGGGGNLGNGDDKARRKAKKLEEENKALKEKLQQLEQLIQASGISATNDNHSNSKNSKDEKAKTSVGEDRGKKKIENFFSQFFNHQ